MQHSQMFQSIRNTRDENEDIKNGKMPDSWDNEHKIR